MVRYKYTYSRTAAVLGTHANPIELPESPPIVDHDPPPSPNLEAHGPIPSLRDDHGLPPSPSMETHGPSSSLREDHGPPLPPRDDHGPPTFLREDHGPTHPPRDDHGPPTFLREDHGPPLPPRDNHGPPLPPRDYRRSISEEDIDAIDSMFRSSLQKQIVKNYSYSPGDCFFDSVTYLQFLRADVELNNRSRSTNYSDNLRRQAVTSVRQLLDGPENELLTVLINEVKDLHDNLTSETPPSYYLELMSKPAREGGIWGDYFIAVYVALLVGRPIICYNMNLILTTGNLRSNWDSLDLFSEAVDPFYIAWANGHFYPMIPVEHYGLRDMDMNSIDVDKANFLMLIKDLPGFVGSIARPANRKVKVNDLEQFKNWLHVISDPVVVKVHAGDNVNQRTNFKKRIVSRLRRSHGLVLTPNEDSLTLSTNQVNISVQAIAMVLYDLGVQTCRVLTFGMKWRIPMAEPKIDFFINRYFASVGQNDLHALNVFDYGVVDYEMNRDMLNSFSFTDTQISENSRHQHFRVKEVYEMFGVRRSGSISFKPTFHWAFEEVKIYPELVHEVLSVLKRQTLDDMPKTIQTIRTRHTQLQKLLQHWERMSPTKRAARLLGSRIEATVRTRTVAEGRVLCISENVLRIRGIEARLHGSFKVIGISIDTMLADFKHHLTTLERRIHGRYERQPTILMRSSLTKTRQSFGWSGKHMKKHLREQRTFQNAMERQKANREASGYQYDGWQQDDPQDRPLILDFLENAHWLYPPRLKERHNVTPIMLRRPHSGGALPINYQDQVEAARYYIERFGRNWRLHVDAKTM